MFPNYGRLFAIAAILLCSIPLQAQRQSLSFKPVEVQYSSALDRVIAISGTPDTLHIYDPVANADNTVALSGAPLSLSVSPDGLHAAVGHAASIEYVNLQSRTVEKTFTGLTLNDPLYNGQPGHVVVGNGYIYAMPQYGGNPLSIQISSGAVVTGTSFYYSSEGVFDPAANAVYTGQDGSFPQSLLRFDASAGPLGSPTTYKYFNQFNVCSPIWVSADMNRIFTGCGTIFSASADTSKDMLYISSLPGITRVQALASASTGTLAVVPTTPDWLTPSNADTSINIYDSAYNQTGIFAIPSS